MVAPLAVKESSETTKIGAEKKMYPTNIAVTNAATGSANWALSGNITAITLGKSNTGSSKTLALGNTRSR